MKKEKEVEPFRPHILRKDRFREAECKVRCGGKLHTIKLTGRGRLTLCNHDLRKELALLELGGAECRCLEVLRLWRKTWDDGLGCYSNRARLPVPLRDAYDSRWCDRGTRRFNEDGGPDPLALPLPVRLPRLAEAAATEVLGKCGYRRSQSGGDHVVRVYIAESRYCGANGGGTRHPSSKFGRTVTTSNWDVTIPPSWYYQVYLRDLSVVDGHFVLRVISKDPLEVVAVRQGLGFNLTVCEAVVRQGATGPRLRWRKSSRNSKAATSDTY